MIEWRKIPGWPYEASSDGQVRRVGRLVSLRAAIDRKTHYFKVCLHNAREGKKRTMFTVHSLVAVAFLGPCPEGLEVNHKDRKRSNNNVDNLEYLTHLENARHGPTYSGERNPAAKLNSAKVLEMRRLYAEGHSPGFLARQFRIQRQTAVDAISGAHWSHVPNAQPLRRAAFKQSQAKE